MALDLALGRKTHDLVFSTPTQPGTGFDLILIDNAERVAQQIKVTLLAFLGEWFLDVSWGTPYLEYILIKSARRGVIESVLRARITAVPDVRRVTSLTLQMDTVLRRLQVTFEADTRLGLINRSVILSQDDERNISAVPGERTDPSLGDFTSDFVPEDFS
jgi:hypothetical protein